MDATLTGRARPAPSLLARLWRARVAYLFLLPTFVLLGYFLYYPVFAALTGAFTNDDGFLQREFVGTQNFRRAYQELTTPGGPLGYAVRNNALWLVFDVVLALLPPLIVAELVFHLRSTRAQYIYRTLFVAQIVVPGVVALLLWQEFYRSDGLVNDVFGALGLPTSTRGWLGDPDTALYALMLLGFPWINAFNLLILYSGLQAIPEDVLDAARIDGAMGLRRVRHIDLPLLRPQFRLLLILTVIGSVQNFLAAKVVTNGGPGFSTLTAMLYTYDTAFEYGQFGYSMSLSFVLFVVVLLLTLISRRGERT